jgi:hypothetical protein
MARLYTLATERNGEIVALKVPPMAIRQAEIHARRLRDLMPGTPVYVINATAI